MNTTTESPRSDETVPRKSRFGSTRVRIVTGSAAIATVAAVCLGFGLVSAQAAPSAGAKSGTSASSTTSTRAAANSSPSMKSVDSTSSSAVAPAATAPILPAATATDGWLRIAHLSPDTTAVNVKVTALSGGTQTIQLDNVAYGSVSPYMHLPSGTYVISMYPGNASSSTKPMVTASIKIVQGKSVTVAAFGKNKMLSTKVFQDDLAAPTSGSARIRLIQASTTTSSVNVETTTGILIAANAMSGASTSYADVPAGSWVLNLSTKSMTDATALQLAKGTVSTLFVLDNAKGGLTIKPVLDSSSVGSDPVGGINTGGGWAATNDPAAVGNHG
jgi:hypothetical protein